MLVLVDVDELVELEVDVEEELLELVEVEVEVVVEITVPNCSYPFDFSTPPILLKSALTAKSTSFSFA